MKDGEQSAGYSALAKAAGAYDAFDHPLEALVPTDTVLDGDTRPLAHAQLRQWRSLSTAMLILGGIALVVGAIVLLGSGT